ncbi:MAG TPA: flavodoxin family protein [Methanoregula sp.]|nr:flavodoxin family protein [Methanoregula sp.]
MEPVRKRVRSVEINAGKERYLLILDSEDFSVLYPGMIRYTLTVKDGERIISVFRTNSFEYSPLVPLAAETVANQTADEWEREIRNNPLDFILNHRQRVPKREASLTSDLVVIQGSPRALGNCGILAGWAVDAAQELGRTAQVIYPHDMDIRCCIGCYQCYNTGTCVFEDDMGNIIGAIREASLLVVCAPVYTNTVPGGLKLLIDRCQAYHAERSLSGGRTGQKGLIFSVAGRKGEENFTCTTRVISAFLRNLGITPGGEILIDRIDSVRDIRTIAGLEDTVRKKVQHCLIANKVPEK